MIGVITIKDVKLQLGELCKQKRQIYEMSQEDLAVALDLSRYTIQKFENGKNATLDTVLKIVNHFDLLNNLYLALKDIENTNDINSLY
ncbi:helix-turn-helix transcriptional regulator [Winogradskyella immobilis]|uniref:Helix-turn-helix transcriptional regulator n=1 Tax=Winogradskyella immobilis TaxID=2816852 RepID=A0ABS8EP25_9FLAO|nr:helix-turn-helix transcriptional regulator [Winogradskyella immobilis]MCC1484964.1 helix-turn-helix transcriptional regulator [Winogradskyella immobilis]MCG0017056.1 helix-turn-helix transcriptional regulator [Winogradskyella immobilis]